jgi:hypothetical protein
MERAVEKSVVTLEVVVWNDQQGEQCYIHRNGSGTGIRTSMDWNWIISYICRSQLTQGDPFWYPDWNLILIDRLELVVVEL